MKKKQEKEGKNRIRTLFEVGMKKAKDTPLLPTQPEASASKTRHPLSVPSPVIIHPSQLQADKTKERQGCVHQITLRVVRVLLNFLLRLSILILFPEVTGLV